MLWLLTACGDSSTSGGGGAAGGGTSIDGSSSASGGGGGQGQGAGPEGGANQGGSGGAPPAVNGLPTAWPDGTDCASEAPIFVWEYAEDTYILRQSLCTSFEGPFLYLLFGEDKVLLEDTGDGGIPLATTVQAVIDEVLAARGQASIELVVTHSHAHGDHVAGDAQMQGLPNTTVVGTSTAQVQSFFGFSNWPDETVSYDLGGRVVDVIPIPGHQQAHIALYDRRHQLLLTGDTLYPGRLYVQDFAEYVDSVERLTTFVGTSNPVTWVLGTHIEMTTAPGQDFAFGAEEHPGEHALELELTHLLELEAAVQAMGNSPQYEAHDDFIIYPL